MTYKNASARSGSSSNSFTFQLDSHTQRIPTEYLSLYGAPEPSQPSFTGIAASHLSLYLFAPPRNLTPPTRNPFDTRTFPSAGRA